MGKNKKVTPKKDEKQRSISAFFKAGTSNPLVGRVKKSQLFTTVDQSIKTKIKHGTGSKESDSAIPNTIQDLKEKHGKRPDKPASFSPSSFASSQDEDLVIIEDTPPHNKRKTEFGAKSKSKPLLDDSKLTKRTFGAEPKKVLVANEISTESKCSASSKIDPKGTTAFDEVKLIKTGSPSTEILSIPETQMLDDDTNRKSEKFLNEFKVSKPPSQSGVSSDDSLIIPDTPDSNLSKTFAVKKRLPSNRSFLSSTTVITKPVQFLNSVQMKNRMKRIKEQQKKTRNFEDAYKEMLNAKAEEEGEKLEKADLSMVLGHVGPLFPKKSGTPGSCSLQNKEASKSDGKKKNAIVCSLSGIKRSASRGDSPNPKRVANRKTPAKMVASNSIEKDSGKVCRRKLSLDDTKEIAKKKSTGWNVDVKLNEDDNVLTDILNEMKMDGMNPKRRKSTERAEKAVVPDLTPEVTGEDDIMEVDANEALDDIMAELKQNIVSQNSNTVKDKSKPNVVKHSRTSSGGHKASLFVARMQQDIEKKAEDIGYIDMESQCSTNTDTGMEIDEFNTQSMEIAKKGEKTLWGDDLLLIEGGSPTQKDFESKPTEYKAELTVSHKEESQQDLTNDFSKLSPFKKRPQQTADRQDAKPPCADYGRYKVISVNKTRSEVILDLESEFHQGPRKAILQGFWLDTSVSEGDIINVIGEFTDGVCYVTDQQNLIIVQPDQLISGTTVVSCVYCMRKSVLNERFKGYEGKNIYMLYGSIIHCVFQEVLQQKATTLTGMKAIAEKIVREIKFLHDMYGQMYDEAKVMEEVDKYIPQMMQFSDKHAQFKAGIKTPAEGEVAVTRVADIEENIWSPKFGIKGKIDLTVEVKIKEKSKGWTKRLVPLELKTGRPTFSIEHKGQVTLYTMMTSDRRADPKAGLLLYLKDGSMKTIPADYANKRGLIQLRNELANHMCETLRASRENGGRWSGGLPQPINNARSCPKCPQLLNCCLYQKQVEGWQAPEGHAMNTLVGNTVQHLADAHREYYAHWIHLLHIEMSTGGRKDALTKDIWCKTARQREHEGHCISSIVLDVSKCSEAGNDLGQYYSTFQRQPGNHSELSLSNIGIGKGESVIVSADNKPLLSLALASVTDITDTSVSILCDRDLRNYEQDGQTVYRLDKCDAFNTMAINFNNLTRLMEATATSEKLRQIVIEKRKPEFDLTMPKNFIEKVKPIFKSLNKPQKTAILKVLMAKDYVLIKGYPGTGKTSTIVSLVCMLVTLGQSVLLASYTHSAVDNILLKLKQHDVNFVRIGRLGRIHPDIQQYSSERLTKDFKSVAELDQFYLSKSVVATTCLGTNHAVFSRRTFDVCIVDEASQVLQPACLGPLFCSRRFVLVGDPLQLPPVVQNKEAREAGMSESLFARLDKAGGTYELNLQYRMNSTIMRLSNELVYSGALKCGSSTVASQRLAGYSWQHIKEVYPPWVNEALSPLEGKEVIFINTDKMDVQSEEMGTDSAVSSQREAQVVTTLTKAALKIGLKENDIGVITPYRQQVRLLRDLLTQKGHPKVEVNTVDQYQGRDKPIIMVSFVKSSTDGRVSEILRDVRRLNVALTRAKYKMILIGSVSTLVTYDPLAKLIHLLKKQQIVHIPCKSE